MGENSVDIPVLKSRYLWQPVVMTDGEKVIVNEKAAQSAAFSKKL